MKTQLKIFSALIIFTLISKALIAQVSNEEDAGPVRDDVPAMSTILKAGPKIQFLETSKDFGNITQGEKVSYDFTFRNTGTEPLVLSNVQTTCGCTATNWPREPIAPGEMKKIAATFNSAGKSGKQDKVITITSNANDGVMKVHIICNVLPAAPAPAPTPVPANDQKKPAESGH
ncbi:MAG: hypothetical protein A3G23_00745 [Bacteroidetes bacterium RIFCSPLOWO2_12_FULL_37_12]|nr:MAG: hypothetical protein A3G23_00745 [Bacteroidetes bacterium RIFCSPLOWO2_12_FULL_37_12]